MGNKASAVAARREGYVLPGVEQAMLWDRLLSRLRQLQRYQVYVGQVIRPLWLDLYEADVEFQLLPEFALLIPNSSTEPGSPGWKYRRKLVMDPAREFGIVATSGRTPSRLIEAIHEDAAA